MPTVIVTGFSKKLWFITKFPDGSMGVVGGDAQFVAREILQRNRGRALGPYHCKRDALKMLRGFLDGYAQPVYFLSVNDADGTVNGRIWIKKTPDRGWADKLPRDIALMGPYHEGQKIPVEFSTVPAEDEFPERMRDGVVTVCLN